MGKVSPSFGGRMDDALEWLARENPELLDHITGINPLGPGPNRGIYNPRSREIEIDPQLPDSLFFMTLGHETQHAKDFMDPLMLDRHRAEVSSGVPYRQQTVERIAFPAGISRGFRMMSAPQEVLPFPNEAELAQEALAKWDRSGWNPLDQPNWDWGGDVEFTPLRVNRGFQMRLPYED